MALTIEPVADLQEAWLCAEMMSTMPPWPTLGRDFHDALELFQDPERERYLVRLEDQPVGFLVLALSGPFVGYIQSVGLLPEYRGQGRGSELIRFAEKRIFRDHPNVFICASTFNHRAQSLYIRLGYQIVGELADFVVEGHGEILMRKTRGPLVTKI